MDVLTDVLNSLRLHGTLYCRSILRAPWCLAFGATRAATFHVIEGGSCWLTIEGQPTPIPLAGGDVIVLPRGAAHQISSDPALPPVVTIQLDNEVPDACEVRQVDGAGPQTVLLCGLFDYAQDNGHPLLGLLSPLLHISGEQGQLVPWLDATLKFLASEAGSQQPGAVTLTRRLADILFIQIVRAWVVQAGKAARGWLGALHDPQIGAALGAIHRNPAHPWTVEALAMEVAMSRSGFAARFTALVGETPLQYVTNWRMRAAAGMLQHGALGTAEIAHRVGYGSEIAFSKAFKRTLGVAPGAYRRSQRQPRPEAMA